MSSALIAGDPVESWERMMLTFAIDTPAWETFRGLIARPHPSRPGWWLGHASVIEHDADAADSGEDASDA